MGLHNYRNKHDLPHWDTSWKRSGTSAPCWQAQRHKQTQRPYICGVLRLRPNKSCTLFFSVTSHSAPRSSICLTADAAYRLCVCSWGSSHFSPSASFIPQSSPAALVYSNQGLAEECQKAFRSGIWNPLSFGCRALSPRSDSSAAKQKQQSERAASAERIAFHCWLVAAGGPQEPGVTQLLFPAIAERGKRDQTKAGRSLWAPAWSLSVFLCSPSAGIPAGVGCLAPLSRSFIFLFLLFIYFFKWLLGGGRGRWGDPHHCLGFIVSR